jgi:hypothetical protein
LLESGNVLKVEDLILERRNLNRIIEELTDVNALLREDVEKYNNLVRTKHIERIV